MKLLLAVAAHVGVAAWITRELRDIRREIVKLHWIATQPTKERLVQKVRIAEQVQPFDRFDTPAQFETKLRSVRR